MSTSSPDILQTSTEMPVMEQTSTQIPNLFQTTTQNPFINQLKANKGLLPECNYNIGLEHIFLDNDDFLEISGLKWNVFICYGIIFSLVIPILGISMLYVSYKMYTLPKTQQKQKTQQTNKNKFPTINGGNALLNVFTIFLNYLWISSIVYIPLYNKKIDEIKRQNKKPCVFMDQVYV
jgi:hypothetical protein